jgi:hypothetical protein
MTTAGAMPVYNVSIPVHIDHIRTTSYARPETIDGLVVLVVVAGPVDDMLIPEAMEHVVRLTATVDHDYSSRQGGSAGNVAKIAKVGRTGG